MNGLTEKGWFKRLAALGLVGGLVAIVVVALTMFAGGFTETVPVMITAPRSGLVMDPDAKVKMRGVEVGRVKSIEETPDGATITLDMQPDMLKNIPANSKVDIKSTTVFGAKYVNFVFPSDPSPEHLTAGSTVAAPRVTVEFNTLFQHLSDVLQTLEPEKINATLGALSEALRGRGKQVGELLTDADAYLTDINPSLPALQQDFKSAAEVTNLYADVAPDLVRLLDDATAIGGTLVDERDNLESLLLSLIGVANTGETVLGENEQNLTTALDLLRPTTALLDRYSPVLSCLILGLDKARPIAEAVEGGLQEGIALNAGFTYSQKPYMYPDSLPKVNATGGPNCVGLPDRVPSDPHAPYIVTDTANVPYVPNTQLTFNAPKVFQILFADLFAGLAQR